MLRVLPAAERGERCRTKRLRWYDETPCAEELEAHLRKRMSLSDTDWAESIGTASSQEEMQATTVSGHHRVREEEESDEERVRQKYVKLEDLDVQTGEALGEGEDWHLGCLLGRKRYARRVDYLVDKLIESAALRRRTGELICSASRGAAGENGLPLYIPRGSHPMQDHLLSLAPRSLLRSVPSLCQPSEDSTGERASEQEREQEQGLEEEQEQEEEKEEEDMGGGVTHKEWGMIHVLAPGSSTTADVDGIEEDENADEVSRGAMDRGGMDVDSSPR